MTTDPDRLREKPRDSVKMQFRLLALPLIGLLWPIPLSAIEPPVTALAYTPAGDQVLAGSQAGLQLLGWPDLQLEAELPSAMVQIHDLAFSPDGEWLAAGGGSPAEEGVIEFYRWSTRDRLPPVITHEDVVLAVSWRDDAGQLASASHDRQIQLHDLRAEAASVAASGTLEGHSRGVNGVAYVGPRLLVSVGIDQSLRVWELPEGKSLRTLDNHTGQVHGLAVRPGVATSYPMVVSVSDDRTIRLWQPTIGRMMRFVRLQRIVPLAVTWSADGRYIAAACNDGHLRIVDPDTVEVLYDLPAINGWAYCLAAHPTQPQFCVGGYDGQVKRVVVPVP